MFLYTFGRIKFSRKLDNSVGGRIAIEEETELNRMKWVRILVTNDGRSIP